LQALRIFSFDQRGHFRSLEPRQQLLPEAILEWQLPAL